MLIKMVNCTFIKASMTVCKTTRALLFSVHKHQVQSFHLKKKQMNGGTCIQPKWKDNWCLTRSQFACTSNKGVFYPVKKPLYVKSIIMCCLSVYPLLLPKSIRIPGHSETIIHNNSTEWIRHCFERKSTLHLLQGNFSFHSLCHGLLLLTKYLMVVVSA